MENDQVKLETEIEMYSENKENSVDMKTNAKLKTNQTSYYCNIFLVTFFVVATGCGTLSYFLETQFETNNTNSSLFFRLLQPTNCTCMMHTTLNNATEECKKLVQLGHVCDVYSYDLSNNESNNESNDESNDESNNESDNESDNEYSDLQRQLYDIVPNLPEVITEDYLPTDKVTTSFSDYRVLNEVTSFYMQWYSCKHCVP